MLLVLGTMIVIAGAVRLAAAAVMADPHERLKALVWLGTGALAAIVPV